MSGMHLKQHGFTYSACDLFNKNKEKNQKQEMQIILARMILIKLVFNMIWLIQN